MVQSTYLQIKDINMWIRGFEDRYEITKDGEVFFHKNGKRIQRKLVPDKNGYMTINLKIKSKVFCKKIHREVARTYIYPYDGEQVNHINGIKSDNRVDNLEWCSSLENMNHMWSLGLKKKGRKYANNSSGYYGVQVTDANRYTASLRRGIKRFYLGTYDTTEEASSVIKKAIEDEIKGISIKAYRLVKRIYQYDKDMNLIKIYNSISQAEKETGIDNQGIGQNILGKIKTYKGYIWIREQEKKFI
jgi:hypothetical protein